MKKSKLTFFISFLFLVSLFGCNQSDVVHDTISFQVPETSYKADESTISYRLFHECQKYPLPSTYIGSSPVANILTVPYTIGDVDFPYDEAELTSALTKSEDAFSYASHGKMGINLVQTSLLQASKPFLEQLSDPAGIEDYYLATGVASDIENALSDFFTSNDFPKFDSNSDGILDSLVVLRCVEDSYKDANHILTMDCTMRPADGSLLSPHIEQMVFVDIHHLRQDGYSLISHELGHAMGLLDLYDYLPAGNTPLNNHAANTIMAMTGLSDGGLSFSIFNRYLLGWDKPDYFLTPDKYGIFSPRTISLDCEKGESIYIGLDDKIETSPFGQYLILQSAFYEGKPSLLLFHADARLLDDGFTDYHKRFITDPFDTQEQDLLFAFDNNPDRVKDPYMKHPLIYELSNIPNQRNYILANGWNYSWEDLDAFSYFSVGDSFNASGENYSFYGNWAYDYVPLDISFKITGATQNQITIDFSPKVRKPQN